MRVLLKIMHQPKITDNDWFYSWKRMDFGRSVAHFKTQPNEALVQQEKWLKYFMSWKKWSFSEQAFFKYGNHLDRFLTIFKS